MLGAAVENATTWQRNRGKGEEKRGEHVPVVTNEHAVKLDYDYHTH